MSIIKKLCFLGIIGLAASTIYATPTLAQSVADFYKGKTVTIWVGYSPGGGYDTYARTAARYMAKHIPGNPKIIVKNKPGAGSMLVANELYSVLPKDGTAIGVIGRGMPMEPLLGNSSAKFDASKFNWLGSANNEVSVCVSWKTTGITNWKQLLTKQMTVGGTGPGADTDSFPKVMNNILGTKLKLVTGYPGGTDVNFAMERGELDGRCGYSWTSLKSRKADWLKEKKVTVLLQMSTAKHADIPDVPFIMDQAKNDKERQVLSFIFARQAWGRPFLAPPGIPMDRVKALKTAFMATMNDPAYKKDAVKQKLEVAPIDGDTIAKLVADLYNAPKDIIEAAKLATESAAKTEISKAVIPIETVKGVITKLRNGARKVSYKGEGRKGSLSVSGSKTKVTIGGKKAKRKKLKVGMKCDFTFQGSAGKAISCG
ncbi:MAG: Bug family tripartite tricarboxylate transporter substrate binding protein [Rhodospirillales bacterium]|jgi:tripartite-type tricarboxylate transporter receptor subunit TctC